MTATAASIGAAGIPQAGLITMVRNMQLIWFIVIYKNILISFQGHGTWHGWTASWRCHNYHCSWLAPVSYSIILVMIINWHVFELQRSIPNNNQRYVRCPWNDTCWSSLKRRTIKRITIGMNDHMHALIHDQRVIFCLKCRKMESHMNL